MAIKWGVRYDDSAVIKSLSELSTKISDMRPAFTEIGDTLKTATLLNFVNQSDPSGAPWKPLLEETIRRRRKGRRGGTPKILRDTGRLMNSITRRVYPDMVEVGTNVGYGIAHQFGIGVPTRQFLGLNPALERGILGIVEKHLKPGKSGK